MLNTLICTQQGYNRFGSFEGSTIYEVRPGEPGFATLYKAALAGPVEVQEPAYEGADCGTLYFYEIVVGLPSHHY